MNQSRVSPAVDPGESGMSRQGPYAQGAPGPVNSLWHQDVCTLRALVFIRDLSAQALLDGA